MTKYQLAKLVAMTGKLESRKRIQKTVHLLKAAGCQIEAEYRLHYYGPYSADVAELLDQMTSEGIFQETPRAVGEMTRYDYALTPAFEEKLAEVDATEAGRAAGAIFEPYEALLKRLQMTPPKTLELAATIVAFHQGGRDMEQAVQEACNFKHEVLDRPRALDAKRLAEEVLAWGS